MNNKNNKNPVCHLKYPLYKDSVMVMLKIFLNKCKKFKLQKYTQTNKKSMQTIELKLFNYSLKRIRVDYNNSIRFLYALSRHVSAREEQVLNNITTFDAILRKMFYSFVHRCYESNNKLISFLMASKCFINSSYYKHYNSVVYL